MAETGNSSCRRSKKARAGQENALPLPKASQVAPMTYREVILYGDSTGVRAALHLAGELSNNENIELHQSPFAA
jgi:NADPH-dependent ferric siderophore reductase